MSNRFNSFSASRIRSKYILQHMLPNSSTHHQSYVTLVTGTDSTPCNLTALSNVNHSPRLCMLKVCRRLLAHTETGMQVTYIQHLYSPQHRTTRQHDKIDKSRLKLAHSNMTVWLHTQVQPPHCISRY
jgi:hypothetical protein